MAISSKDIETLWGRYQSEGNDKTVAQGLALKNSVTVSHVNICLSNGMRIDHHKLPNYMDMRGGYDKLSGVVSSLGENPENGTAYVFMSKNQKLVKIIRYEKGRCLYYSQKFKGGFSFVRLRFDVDKPVYVLQWKHDNASPVCDESNRRLVA